MTVKIHRSTSGVAKAFRAHDYRRAEARVPPTEQLSTVDCRGRSRIHGVTGWPFSGYVHCVSTLRSRRVGRLPAEWTSFVDRRRELADVKRLLSDQRLVTLTGVAGVGKTRLAHRVAEQLVRATSGGVWWVDLDQLQDPQLVPAAVLQVLDLPVPAPAAPVARLVEFFAERPSLLVLD